MGSAARFLSFISVDGYGGFGGPVVEGERSRLVVRLRGLRGSGRTWAGCARCIAEIWLDFERVQQVWTWMEMRLVRWSTKMVAAMWL